MTKLINTRVTITGFYASFAAFIAVIGYGVVQVLQLTGTIVKPLDDILIYSFSLAIAPSFLMSILALHYSVPCEQKFWSHSALLFALMYAVYAVLMYTVQLATVIPLWRHDHTDNILTVKPGSFFWTLDALAYICMGLSTIFASFVFNKGGREKWLRRFLIANGIMVPVIGFVYFCPHFSIMLLLLGSPWLITAAGSLLSIALYFRRTSNNLFSKYQHHE